ncbi:MAG: AMP-binding protein [Chloroflexi bacterium]|nr:AMP-binding protein [Chloroflexota bacterium]
MLAALLAEDARVAPQRVAIVCGSNRLTYADLHLSALELSERLRGWSIGPGDCVATFLPNCSEFVTAFFAAADLTAMFLPLNPLLKPGEIRRHVSGCNARLLLTDSEHAHVCLEATAGLEVRVEVATTERNSASNGPKPVTRDIDPESAFLIQFSSGSTGRLKQVRRSQLNLIAEARNFTSSASVTEQDRILCVVPMHHAHGLGNALLASMYAGGCLVILRPGDAAPAQSRDDYVLELIEQEHITVLPGVPFLFDALADTPEANTRDLSSLRLCFSAGNSLSRSTFDRFLTRFGVQIRQLYGCTEAGSVTMNLDADVASTWDSVGRPLGSVEVLLTDENGGDLPVGTEGDILFRSPALCHGYVNAPEANAAAFQGKHFATGDVGRMDEAGRLYITGRRRPFIDTGGYKVDPAEVEEVLAGHPKVAEAVVVGVQVAGTTELVKAAVVCREDCSRDEILSFCRLQLADYKLPAIVEFVDSIPRSPLGKILRAQVAEPDRPGLCATDLSRIVPQVVSELLGIEPTSVDPERPLMEYGLDSARAVQLALHLGRLTGRDVSATLIWSCPTVAAITETLGTGRVDSADQPAPNHPRLPPLFDRTQIDAVRHLPDAEVRRLLVTPSGANDSATT